MDITPLLLQYPSQDGTVLHTELAKLSPYKTTISQSLASLAAVLAAVQKHFTALNLAMGPMVISLHGTIKKNEVLLGEFYSSYTECRQGCDKGIQFYKGMLVLLQKIQADYDASQLSHSLAHYQPFSLSTPHPSIPPSAQQNQSNHLSQFHQTNPLNQTNSQHGQNNQPNVFQYQPYKPNSSTYPIFKSDP